MTEEEAKTKWCPQRPRTSGEMGVESNDAGQNRNLFFLCVASNCMAWRTLATETDGFNRPLGPTQGYCGLAGAP
jgi:hypothetical protein